MKEQEYQCPLCNGVMTIKSDASGVTAICMSSCVSTCHENVFGHGKNAKDAYETACEKFRKIKP